MTIAVDLGRKATKQTNKLMALNQTILNVHTRYIFQTLFLGIISAILPICIMKKIFISGGISLDIGQKFSFTVTQERSRKTCFWNVYPAKCDIINDVKLFQTVHHRIYCHKFLMLSNQMSPYKIKSIRMVNWTDKEKQIHVYIEHDYLIMKINGSKSVMWL